MRPLQKLTPSGGNADPAACERTVFARARLVLSGEVVTGSLVVEDGRIAGIDTGGTGPAGAIDCEGDLLAPALVELHTDNLERHLEPRPGVRWPLRPAVLAHDAELASVGIGTAFAALRVGSLLSDFEPRGPGKSDYGRYARPVASAIAALGAEGALRIDHLVHLRAEICSETLAEELSEFGADDRVRLVSVMDHTPGERQFRDLDGLRAHLRARHGMTDAAIDARFRRLAALSSRRAAAHEAEIVAQAARLGAALASHDDACAAHVARSAALGVTLAEFPTTLEAARACRGRGIPIAMGAPNLLRGRSHSGNVRAEELAEEGLLDVLSSDYAPSSLLGGAVRLGELAGDLAAGFATVTARPAEMGGLTDRGRLAPGLRADLVRVRLDGIASRVVWTLAERSPHRLSLRGSSHEEGFALRRVGGCIRMRRSRRAAPMGRCPASEAGSSISGGSAVTIRMATMLAVGAALAAAASTGSAAPEGPSVLRAAEGLPSVPITVVEDRAVVIESAVPFVGVSVAQPTIADVSPLSDRTLYVFGRGRGTTTLTLIGEGGRLITNALVQVTPDADAVRRAIDGALAR